MKKSSMSLVLVVVICLFALSTACTEQPSYVQRTLPSGRTIKVSGVTKMNFKKGGHTLMLRYYTDIDISDMNKLQQEVDDIWQSFFKIDVEKAGIKLAIISANEMPKGTVSMTKRHNFIFTRKEDGSWTTKE